MNLLQDMSDIKRMIMSFLDITQLYKGILILKLESQDIAYFFKTNIVYLKSEKQWKSLADLCKTYDCYVHEIFFHFTPKLKLHPCLSKIVHVKYIWKNSGITDLLKFLNFQKNCEKIFVTLLCCSPWNVGVLSNLMNYRNNLYLCVDGHSPLYTREYYLNEPCRFSNLEIICHQKIPVDTLEKIKKMTDYLTISMA